MFENQHIRYEPDSRFAHRRTTCHVQLKIIDFQFSIFNLANQDDRLFEDHYNQLPFHPGC
jgi:hypothetical protein